jgi:3D (Asp-Asp-Asp) domain-containing protein
VRRSATAWITVPALAAGAALIALVPAASGRGSGSPGQQASDLRQENAYLASRSRSVVLELYGLDSRLATARARLAAVTARVAALQKQQRVVKEGLGVARHAHGVSQQALADRVRQLYEQGDEDPLAVLLGASSLDEAVTRLDELHSMAEQDRAVVDQTHATGRRMKHLSRTLAARRAELGALRNQASATVSQIAATRREQAGYLAQLADRRDANLARISQLESQARAAAAQAAALNAAAAVAAAPAPTPARAPATATPTPTAAPGGPTISGNTMIVTATGYTLPGTTATGTPVGYGVVAVDPSVIPLGTRMTIPGYGEGTAADVGSGVAGATIDLWFPSTAAALAWGRRVVTITLH